MPSDIRQTSIEGMDNNNVYIKQWGVINYHALRSMTVYHIWNSGKDEQ